MKITFFGVRGSTPVSGKRFIKYGGNSSCVHIELACGKQLIFDAGTGIKPLGHYLDSLKSPHDVHLLLSHHHWDHIQGFPFFTPIHDSKYAIKLLASPAANLDSIAKNMPILGQMNPLNFPVQPDELSARIEQVSLEGQESYDLFASAQLSTQTLNHPGGGLAYRLDTENTRIAYITDNELTPPGTPSTSYEDWVSFVHQSDVLIHDAQYTQDDMPHKHGWGHSTIDQVLNLARDAEVKCLVLFHHDHERSDHQLDEIAKFCEEKLKQSNLNSQCICAWQGLSLVLTKDGLCEDNSLEL